MSPEAPESRKRQRIEDVVPPVVQQSPQLGTMTRDATLWFDDGNVILTASGVGFRVHRGVLSAVSALFRDMFSMRPVADEDKVDGCPLIAMHDSSQELRHLLQLLYSGHQYVVASCFRVACPRKPQIFVSVSSEYDIFQRRGDVIEELGRN